MNLAVLILIVINCLIYFLQYTDKIQVEDMYSSYLNVFVRKDYSRLIKSGFAHSSIMHLICNMYSLYSIGNAIVFMFGTVMFLVIYFVTMILGQVFALLLRHASHDDYTASVGASGAIFGLIGVYFMVILRLYGFSGFQSIIPSMIPLILISFMPGIDSKGHICSMAVGVVIGYILMTL
ncbi:MAG: rhomboid family intramembrane serine protease [Erysipelotrichaceae bacterium]|nr:rhomboid family intramembrane serine protease [Erysipelotrichaceae bacterium]